MPSKKTIARRKRKEQRKGSWTDDKKKRSSKFGLKSAARKKGKVSEMSPASPFHPDHKTAPPRIAVSHPQTEEVLIPDKKRLVRTRFSFSCGHKTGLLEFPVSQLTQLAKDYSHRNCKPCSRAERAVAESNQRNHYPAGATS